MELESHLDHLSHQGQLLADAAGRGVGTEPVPGCPGWTLRDVVAHVGVVHQWALEAVRGAGRPPATSQDELLRQVPGAAADLPAWYLDQNRALVAGLTGVDTDAELWTLWPDRHQGVAFWARRQAHETVVHRCDVEQAIGTTSVLDPMLAADGIDELLTMAALSHRPWPDRDRVRLAVRTTDTGRAWVLDVHGHERSAELGEAEADTLLEGEAAALLLFLWNRPVHAPLRRSGEEGLWDTWADLVRIR